MPASSENFEFTVSGTDVVQLTHDNDSSTLSRTSNKLKGDGYYGRADGFHTVQYNISGNADNTFTGVIEIQATLAVEPAEADWFIITSTQQTYTGSYGSYMFNFTGNYVWLRAKVYDWTDGTVGSIALNH